MATVRGNAPWLGGLGLLAAVVAGAAVAWGRVRPVTVPLTAPLCEPAVACAAPSLDRDLLIDAVGLLRQHGVNLDVVPSCEAANVVVRVEPMLDDRDSADDIEARLRERVARTWQDVPRSSCVTHADVGVLDGSSLTAIVHGLLHATGRDHPRNPPSGHILDSDRPSLRDWRGVP